MMIWFSHGFYYVDRNDYAEFRQWAEANDVELDCLFSRPEINAVSFKVSRNASVFLLRWG